MLKALKEASVPSSFWLVVGLYLLVSSSTNARACKEMQVSSYAVINSMAETDIS